MNLRSIYVWSVIYDMIRSDLGFSLEDDIRASLTATKLCNIEATLRTEAYIGKLIKDKKVLVVGAADSCTRCCEISKLYDVIIASDGALRCCLEVGVKPHIVVTDLDGIEPKDLLLSDVVFVVHAHGDNIYRLIQYLSYAKGAKNIIITTQVPLLMNSCLRVYGGFTDGDRAAYLAYFFNASTIGFVGFDFEGLVGRYSKPWLKKPIHPSITKLKKFIWAKRLLKLLEYVAGGEVSIEHY